MPLTPSMAPIETQIQLYQDKQAELSKSCGLLSPYDFYRSLFPEGSFEPLGVQDNAADLPNGIALRIKSGRRAYHTVVTDGLEQLDDLLKEDFVIMSPISYFGSRRSTTNSRFLYAMCFDLDDVDVGCLHDVLYQMENDILPRATYIVNSGRGLHLYYAFEDPIPMVPAYRKYMKTLKDALTRVLWNRYTSRRRDPEYQSLMQGFRMVGSPSKLGRDYPVTAYKAFEPVTLQYLYSYVKAADDLAKIKKSLRDPNKLTLEDAKKRYPDWYQRRIVDKQPPGQWNIKRDLYDWWRNRLEEELAVGHRYYGILALAIYARKCPSVTYDELRQDAYALLEPLDAISTDPKNAFTEDDIEAALEAYNDEDFMKVKWTKDHISRISGLSMPVRRRNGRKQSVHMRLMSAQRDVLYPDGEWRKHDKRSVVLSYLKMHPTAKKADVIKATGLSKPTVYKYYDDVLLEVMDGKTLVSVNGGPLEAKSIDEDGYIGLDDLMDTMFSGRDIDNTGD